MRSSFPIRKIGWRTLTRQCSTSVAPSTSTNSAETEIKKHSKKDVDDWKMNLLRILDTEFKSRNQQQRQVEARKQALGNVMRFTLKSDMQSIVRLAENQTRIRETDDVLPMCLLVINKQFEQIMRKVEYINSEESLRLFLNISNLWKSLRQNNDNTTNLMCLLVLGKLRKWKDQRDFDGKSEQIEKIFEGIEKKTQMIVKNGQPDDLRIFLSPEDLKNIKEEFNKVHQFHIPKPKFVDKTKYVESELLEPFETSCSEENYNGNPFNLETTTKENFKQLFEKHMELETSMWIQVKNTVADVENVKEFGEDLIHQWKWEQRIQEELNKLEKEDVHPLVASCLDVIPRQKLVELLHFCALAACSQGQDLLSASQFQYDLITPIVKEMCAIFKRKMGYEEEQIWSRVFETYCEYFSDSEVSRKHTLREWWNKSCSKHGIAANYQFEMGNLDLQSKMEAANVFFDVLQKSCIFPVKNKSNGNVSWQKAFSFRSIAIEEESRITPDGRQSLSRMLSIDKRLSNIFHDSYPFEFIIFSTFNLPMTIPPRPWIDYGIGGPLYTSNVQIIRNMIEFKNIDMNQEVRSRIKTRQQGRPVFDALNQLGSTPWVINEKMLGVLKSVFGRSGDSKSKELLDKLGIPMRQDTVEIPKFEQEFGVGVKKEAIEKERFRDYAKRKAESIKNRNESNSLWCWMLYRVILADHFRGRTLYFPHNMDFRGRVYPLSPYLSHMGDDVNRCILKFAKSQKLGPDGFEWLKLHCINLTGTMKRASVEDRLRKAEEILPAILDSARNPFEGQKWWMESDEPWQTLAACIEIEDALKYGSNPAEFPSQLPIHQDGSCNGLQHYAALGRDNEGGHQVNLTKCDLPNDVYSDVAQRVEQKRLDDEKLIQHEDGDVARRLRQVLPQNVPRKVIKQTVMTTVYGVTMYGAVLQIKRQLRAMDIGNDESAEFARYLARKTFASLNDAFTSSMALKDWFRLCAKGTSELMRTVEWVTPLGLPVVQPYSKAVDRKGKLVLMPIPMKQVDAFPPNYVHSLDSTHMMLTSLNCARNGITFAAVHDCFWTHASSVDEMNQICRQQFVALHSQPLVQQCSEWFKSTYLPPKVSKILPPEVFSKYQDMFTAKVKPGELDIEQVKQSVYFFS